MTTTKNNEHKKLNAPNLRFPEFEGEWEKCTLEDVMNFSTTRVNSSELNEDNYVSTENMLQDYQGVMEAKSVPEDVNVISFSCGDILISNIRPYLKKVWKATYNGGCSSDVFVLKANDNIEYDYLHYVIANDKFINFVMSGAKGVKMPRGDKKQMKTYCLSLPQIQEQKKIATLLRLIDERIATQSKIIDKLQSLIKGIGKQLFMDNQNWRTVRIGELLRIGNGKDYKHLGIGKIPVYGTGGQMLLVNDYLYDGESVCIGRKGTIDTPMFLKGKFWTVDTLFYTYDFKDVLPKFCYYLFLQINWKLYNEGTGVPSLSKSTIENIKVKIPSIEQQHNICSVLDSYEHKTKSEEQILELYLSEKQYLLRQMFI